MTKVIVFISSIFLSSFALGAGWAGDFEVTGVMSEGTSDLVIISVDAVNPLNDKEYTSGCTVNGEWIFKADDPDKINRAYSTAMTALVSGKYIRLWFTDDCGAWSYHQATAIKLLK